MGAARLSASQQRQLIASCPQILKVMVTNLKFLSISFLKWVFIPKAGKATHTTAKDFSPKSLTSFLLKSFE